MIVRPDQCKFHFRSFNQETLVLWLTMHLDVSLITALNDYNGIRDFFGGFALRQGEDLLKTDIFESRCLGKAYV